MNNNILFKSTIKNLHVGALLTFIGINLRFVAGNIINALIFFDILKSGSPVNKYDIHAPSMPDMCGDIIMVIVLAAAYLFITSSNTKGVNIGTFKIRNQKLLPIGPLKDYIHKSRSIFFAVVIAISMYLFSRYVLSIGLEIIFIENTTGICSVLNALNDIMKLCSPLIIVYAYCKYLSTSRRFTFILYLFFIIRNLFATNMLGLISDYDLHVGAPFLDILSPIIIIYSAVYFLTTFMAMQRKEHMLLHGTNQGMTKNIQHHPAINTKMSLESTLHK
ncbi:MAG: hypothetical protein HS132_16800 [Planctomycetia bacterium]|nr:hypothetical protein [Planctomycetia bacterium]